MVHPSLPDHCIIWPSSPAGHHSVQGDKTKRLVKSSARAGTDYVISRDVAINLFNELNTGRLRARLTTQLLNANLRGDIEPEITFDLIQVAMNSQPLLADERAERLLRHIVYKNPDIAVPATLVRDLNDPEALRFPLSHSARAWSESTTMEEIEFLLDYLRHHEYVTLERNNQFTRVTVTVQGHTHVASQLTSTNSSQAFVAMWFDNSMDAIYNHAIAPAIQAAGYEPYRIDRGNFLNKIDDEVIAQIRLSKFVVADFTHGDKDVRGSVYYEAGYAHGLNLPVIFTARERTQPHFDTRQFPHILWNPDDLNTLRQGLTNRILALPELGPGPKSPTLP